MGAWIKVGSIGDVGVGRARCVRVGGRKVVIFNEDGRLHAYNDYCTHVGGPLSQGSYGAQFRVVDGEPISPPAGGKLRSHGVRMTGESVEIQIGDE